MFFIYTAKIRKKEAGLFPQIFSDEVLKASALEVAKGLGIPLGGFKGGKCVKLEVTSKGGAGRTVWRVHGEYIILLLARSKSDPVGENITRKIPIVEEALEKAFDWAETDMDNDTFDLVELEF